jgi:hypothetical protein
MWRHYNMRSKWQQFASRQDWTPRAFFLKVLSSTYANNKHSLLHSIPIHFPTILCELTIYTNTHEQQPCFVGTLSQMTERLAARCVRQETGWLAGGPLLRIPKIRRTTDTFLFISHTTNVLLFKSRCNIVIGVRIVKELPGLVSSGTFCILMDVQEVGLWGYGLDWSGWGQGKVADACKCSSEPLGSMEFFICRVKLYFGLCLLVIPEICSKYRIEIVNATYIMHYIQLKI